MKETLPSNPDTISFAQLQERTFKEMEIELKERLETDPHLNDEEIIIGAFWEQIEPQVRNAIKVLYQKGYWTYSSGFDTNDEQFISGFFPLDKKTKGKLNEIDVATSSGTISFKPENPDLNNIKDKWNAIAELLPKRHKQVPPTWPNGVTEFRNKYAEKKHVKQLLKERESAQFDMAIERLFYEKEEIKEKLSSGDYGYSQTKNELKNRIKFIEREIEELEKNK